MQKRSIQQHRIQKYKIFLFIFLGFAIGMFCWSVYAYYEKTTPDTIRVKAGTREEINLKIPASGVIQTNEPTVISLNQPITIVAGASKDSYELDLKLFGVVPLKKIDIEVIENKMLIPMGCPIGIYLKTQGVLVIDTGSFQGSDGSKYAPSEYCLQAGDYLLAMDGIAITGKKQIKEYVEQSGGKEIVFQLTRNGNSIQVKVVPKQDENNSYKIGAWLRDSAQGIGTLTYIDTENHFGALGHGINDIDTGELLSLGNGLLYQTEIVAIQRGEKGLPGELTGVISYQPDKVSGVITSNTIEGIYGITAQNTLEQVTQEALPVALKHEVSLGTAQIYCNINGNIAYYDVVITQIDEGNEILNRQLSFRVTDEDLLALTGGIVQGMSGAPLLQNGKIIGAVTHVLVNDPTRGYGIFIEDMLAHNY